MKTKLEPMNSRDVKKFNELVNSQWGVDFGKELAFLKSSNDKIYAITKDVANIELNALNIFSMGLYVSTWNSRSLRLSVEGARLLGKVRKNFIEINDEQMIAWMAGNDLELSSSQVGDNSGMLIVYHKEDCLGCGRLSGTRLFNMISKSRKVKIS